MAMRKKCRHVRDGHDPSACGCSWYWTGRVSGRPEDVRLGSDFGRARAQADDLDRMRRAGRLESGGSTLAEVICQYLNEECGPDKIAASTNRSTKAHLQALVRYFSDAEGRTPPISQIG
jgi:hypothetical protein